MSSLDRISRAASSNRGAHFFRAHVATNGEEESGAVFGPTSSQTSTLQNHQLLDEIEAPERCGNSHPICELVYGF